MKSEKEKLAAKSVNALKAAAKRLGGKLVNPDGKAKTKQQLINTIVMKQRLAGKSMGAKATTTKKVTAKKTVAKKPIVKKAVKKSTLGQKIQDYRAIENVRIFDVVFLGPTIASGSRVKINDYRFNESKIIPYGYKNNNEGEVAAEYLNKLGIKIFAKGESSKGFSLCTKDFSTSIKDKA